MTKLALFDLDGTLADDRERAKFYVPGQPTEYWNKERMLGDKVYPQAIEIMERLRGEGWQIGVLTARLESYNREITEFWLSDNKIGVSPILLRPDMLSSLRPPAYKTGVLKSLLSLDTHFTDVVLYDNDIDVVNQIVATLGPQHVVHCTWESDQGEPV